MKILPLQKSVLLIQFSSIRSSISCFRLRRFLRSSPSLFICRISAKYVESGSTFQCSAATTKLLSASSSEHSRGGELQGRLLICSATLRWIASLMAIATWASNFRQWKQFKNFASPYVSCVNCAPHTGHVTELMTVVMKSSYAALFRLVNHPKIECLALC